MISEKEMNKTREKFRSDEHEDMILHPCSYKRRDTDIVRCHMTMGMQLLLSKICLIQTDSSKKNLSSDYDYILSGSSQSRKNNRFLNYS